jgi:hypothetical protein
MGKIMADRAGISHRAACGRVWPNLRPRVGAKETSDGAAFHVGIRFGSLVGNGDLFVLYHGSSFAKQDRAPNVGLFENPTITLPLFLA